MACTMCRLLDKQEGGRYYSDDDPDFVAFEAQTGSGSAPLLVARKHGDSTIPARAFIKMKEIGQKIYGPAFTLQPSHPMEGHYFIRIVELSFCEQSTFPTPVCV